MNNMIIAPNYSVILTNPPPLGGKVEGKRVINFELCSVLQEPVQRNLCFRGANPVERLVRLADNLLVGVGLFEVFTV